MSSKTWGNGYQGILHLRGGSLLSHRWALYVAPLLQLLVPEDISHLQALMKTSKGWVLKEVVLGVNLSGIPHDFTNNPIEGWRRAVSLIPGLPSDWEQEDAKMDGSLVDIQFIYGPLVHNMFPEFCDVIPISADAAVFF